MQYTRLLIATLLAALATGCPASKKSGVGDSGAASAVQSASAQALPFAGHTLELFVGAASKPPTEDAALAFEQKTGAKLVLHFGGSGQMLSSLELSGRGDIYFPGSSDYMDLAKSKGDVVADTEKRIVYLVPSINVPRGNPKGIHTLADLAKPKLRIGIARPDAVCVGLYAVEVLERANLAERVKPNIATNAESCEKDAQLVALGSVDAVLGWSVFEHWDPEHIETVWLDPAQVPRIGYIPIAVATRAKDRPLAEAFIAWVDTGEGKRAFEKWRYFTSVEAARAHAQPDTPVGGTYSLPDRWK